MADILSDEDVFKISAILASDAGAVLKRERIYGELGGGLSELDGLKSRVFIENSGDTGFFRAVLIKFQAKQGTVTGLIARLKRLELLNVAEKVQAEYPSSRAGTSTTANVSTLTVKPNALATYVFKTCSKTLEENLNGDAILTELFCKDVLTRPERENIEHLRSSRNRLQLVETMMTKEKSSVLTFIKVIKENTAGQEYIVTELEAAVKDFENQERS